MRARTPICIASLFLALVLVLTPAVALAQGEPVSNDPYADATTLPWDDGTYRVAVSMEGGSGKASVSSPAEVTVAEGKAVARIVWSSPNYDYMVVAGKTYLPVNEDGNSVFVIPLLAIDQAFDVIGDTTAMSKPHEVAYQLTFDAASAVSASGTSSAQGFPLPVIAACVAAAGAGVAIVLIRKKGER